MPATPDKIAGIGWRADENPAPASRCNRGTTAGTSSPDHPHIHLGNDFEAGWMMKQSR